MNIQMNSQEVDNAARLTLQLFLNILSSSYENISLLKSFVTVNDPFASL